MKQFNLKEYLKDPSRKVVTRDGKPVRIICTDAHQVYDDIPGTFPIVALIKESKNKELTYTYREDGRYRDGENCYSCDLFFATVKREGWVNLYLDPCGRIAHETTVTADPVVYPTKERAQESKAYSTYIDTVHIEWEE